MIIFCLINLFFNFTQAALLSHVSDTISTSWPATGADHIVRFTAATSVPSSGKIIITPEEGFFYIPAINYNDVRFFINQAEQNLGSSAGDNTSGVSVTSGLEGNITITLAANLTISPQDEIMVQVGLGVENRQIVNPAAKGSYKIRIKTMDSAENILDTGTAMIAILDPIQVGTEIIREDPVIKTLQAYVSDPHTATLYGALINLGSTSWGDIFFQYREKGLEQWQETSKTTIEEPLIFTRLLAALDEEIAYEFRAGVEWLKWDEEDSQFVLTTTFGEILELILKDVEEEEDPYPPPPPPMPLVEEGVPANPPPPAPLTPPPYLIFHGWSFPGGEVTLLEENEIISSLQAGPSSEFRFDINEPLTDITRFVLRAQDTENRKSVDIPFAIEGDPEKVMMIANIIFAPTIELSIDRAEIGDYLDIFGQTVPMSIVEIVIINSQGEEALKINVTADNSGNWILNLDTTDWEEDRYKVRARSIIFEEESGYSRVLNFNIGDVCLIADLNCDGRVDLIDFSILMYYWGTTDPRADINGDGRVDVIDFSIMMAHWTG